MSDELDWFARLRPGIDAMPDEVFDGLRDDLFRSHLSDGGPFAEDALIIPSHRSDTPGARRRLTMVVAVLVIVAVGVAGVAAVRNRTGGTAPAATDSTTVPRRAGLIFSATTGTEREVFTGSVSSNESTADIVITRVSDTEICFELPRVPGTDEMCGDLGTLRTGLLYGVHGLPDGGFLVAGVVPDGVDTVEVADAEVVTAGNTWSVRLRDATARSLRVADSEAEIDVFVPPALDGQVPETTP